ncbi:MAG TPA: formimidoylglutamate deiminase [Bryobacteraceae bacterium]|nr:formimidoylglutamate deiminase [Bryobacteraceae bacterium]
MSAAPQPGWLPDLLYLGGRFQSGVAMFADPHGRIARFSSLPGDLRMARRLSNKALLPGLVNAHSHSFQRAIRARTEHRTGPGRDSFWTWRQAMYRAANRLSPQDLFDVARMAFLEMLASGITTVGEFHYLHHAPDGTPYAHRNLLAETLIRASADVGIRLALLRAAYARAGFQTPPHPGQARFLTPRVEDFLADTEQLLSCVANSSPPFRAWLGVAPHSIRALPLPYLLAVAEFARKRRLVLHMHVAEQPAEVEACQAEFGLRPVELLHQRGILNARFTAVHAIHLAEREVECLAQARAHICACPTTERNLGDGVAPAQLWAAANLSVCFGTDSNIQIDLLEDARQLEYHLRLERLERAVLASGEDPESLAKRLFAGATQAGAASLGAPAGSLQEGLAADFFTVALDDLSIAGAGPDSLLAHIVFSAGRSAVRDVFVAGRPVLEDGHHPLRHEIVRRFQDLQRRLWSEGS